jgi:hypothetical protein
MKTKLLIATAVAAVLVGNGFAAAEEQHRGGAAPAAKAAPAPRAAAPHAAPSGGAPRAAIQHAPSAPARAQTQFQRSAPVRTQAQVHEQRGPAINRQARPDRDFGNRVGQTERLNRGSRTEIRSGQVERNRATSDRNHRGADRTGTVETNRSSTRSSASFSTEQRTRIRETILRGRHAPRMARPDFDIRVGYRIPRDRLHFALLPLPDTIVDIEPQWQGYLYFLVGDEVVVVDPDTYEIVAVLPA